MHEEGDQYSSHHDPKNFSTVEETLIMPDKWETLNIWLPFRLIAVGLTKETYETNAWVNNKCLKLELLRLHRIKCIICLNMQLFGRLRTQATKENTRHLFQDLGKLSKESRIEEDKPISKTLEKY